jgi:hypothetical protein
MAHGRSKEWKDLKDFISERMRLPWDEFNRMPVAGIPNTVRLAAVRVKNALSLYATRLYPCRPTTDPRER